MYLEVAGLEELCLFFHKTCSKSVLPAERWETSKSSLPWYDRHYSLHRSLLRFHKIPLKTWVHLKVPRHPRVTTAEKQCPHIINRASLVAQMVKHLPTTQETRFDPWVRKIPWRRKWQPTSVLFPGKYHRRRILVGYSPWGCKESDMTE